LEVPQGQNHSRVMLHVRLYVLVDLVSPSKTFKQMMTLLINFQQQLLGHLLLLLPSSCKRAKHHQRWLHLERLLAHVCFHCAVHWTVSHPTPSLLSTVF
jgi:hypothetical protein